MTYTDTAVLECEVCEQDTINEGSVAVVGRFEHQAFATAECREVALCDACAEVYEDIEVECIPCGIYLN